MKQGVQPILEACQLSLLITQCGYKLYEFGSFFSWASCYLITSWRKPCSLRQVDAAARNPWAGFYF